MVTREEVLMTIRELAEKLGHPPTFVELERLTAVRRRAVRKHFGSYTWALREAGLGNRYNAHLIPTDKLFTEWAGVTRALKKIPSVKEFEQASQMTVGPFQRRFRHWSRVPEAMGEYAAQKALENEWQDVVDLIRQSCHEGPAAVGVQWPAGGTRTMAARGDRPVYGPAMVPAALVHEPINEMGVVYLFGTVAERLGYMVTLVQAEFPDCEALQQVGPGRWQRIRIEFEYESRNFLRHDHNVADCDMIVCWKHNWPECPLEVVELREVVRRQ